MIRLVRTDAEDKDLHSLVELLDAELKVRDGEDHYFFAQFNKLAGILGVVIAYDGETAVGCGGFKESAAGEAEIKRMFVRAEYQGQRIAAKVLAELELWAGESGYSSCVLETGFKQPEAIALYQREGYEVIPNYGQYADVPFDCTYPFKTRSINKRGSDPEKSRALIAHGFLRISSLYDRNHFFADGTAVRFSRK